MNYYNVTEMFSTGVNTNLHISLATRLKSIYHRSGSQRLGLWSPEVLKFLPWSLQPEAFFNLEPRQT